MRLAGPQRVCVFCGSRDGANPRYLQAARQLGQSLAVAGHEVVYGGSRSGCMGALADGALQAGGRVIGIVPRHLHADEQRHTGLSVLEITDDLASRKLRMFARSDAVLVLPGGSGTLDEFLEALTMKRIGQLQLPIALVDLEYFFAPVVAMLRHFVATGFAEGTQMQLFAHLDSVPSACEWVATHAVLKQRVAI